MLVFIIVTVLTAVPYINSWRDATREVLAETIVRDSDEVTAALCGDTVVDIGVAADILGPTGQERVAWVYSGDVVMVVVVDLVAEKVARILLSSGRNSY